MRKLFALLVVAGVFTVSFLISANFYPDWTFRTLTAAKVHKSVALWRLRYHRHGETVDGQIRQSIRTGNTVTLYPDGTSFRVPQDWLDWDARFHDNFHLTRAELAEVKNGAGEWDTEYGKVVNAILPFDQCAAHVGGEGWGKNGVSFSDVQLRAYITDIAPNLIVSRLSGQLAVVRTFATYMGYSKFDDMGVMGRWRTVQLEYGLSYGDYNGTAQVRLYATPSKGHTLALFFMSSPFGRIGSSAENEIQSILKSVALTD